MRKLMWMVLAWLPGLVGAQLRDTRAELAVEGRSDELSVAPDGSLWLTSAVGHIYHTEHILQPWQYSKPPFEAGTDESGLGSPSLGRITFFNRDTAFISGYISSDKDGERKDGLYRTEDGGKSWTPTRFRGDDNIYDAFADGQGRAWMGGSSGKIYYSEDYGKVWRKRSSPFNAITRMHSIFMATPRQGIAGALHNRLYRTEDNWASFTRIPTPSDQKAHRSKDADDRIEKIVYWKQWLVVNQNGHVFYTGRDKISWQKFPVAIIAFEVSASDNRLYALNRELKAVAFDTPDRYTVIHATALQEYPLDIKVVNNALYALDQGHNVYRITPLQFVATPLYTTDHPIPTPALTQKATFLTWGINGQHLYLSDDFGKSWYRQAVLPFWAVSLQLRNDSTALLWDGIRHNYEYSLATRTWRLYHPAAPLKEFLSVPVERVAIQAGSQGCFHLRIHSIGYQRSGYRFALTTQSRTENGEGEADSTVSFSHSFTSQLMDSLLLDINRSPEETPSLRDFEITPADREQYRQLLAKMSPRWENDYKGEQPLRLRFYESITRQLDTLGQATLAAVLNQPEGIWSTTSNWFGVAIVNRNGDTLTFSRRYYEHATAWHLPWVVQYKGQYFSCHRLAFSRFIRNCLPEDFMNATLFSNRYLLMDMADYFYEQERVRRRQDE